ncbi:MAG: glycosyltransferase [Planctomycetota bacterium]|nr:glycosyltransferase [Planctomycetota bacterium]
MRRSSVLFDRFARLFRPLWRTPLVPEASVIIPNFNNGRRSSLDGRTDLLGDLLSSIERTLGERLARIEVVIADDGSSDDSLETARRWVEGHPGRGAGSRRLIESSHCGVLSSVLNRLMGATVGPVVFRFDGDILLLEEGWLDRALARFSMDPALGVLGGLQLAPDGSVLGAGDLLFHPHGYQHLGAGLSADDRIDSLVPDHVMGCFHVMRRTAFESVGPYDESILRGQTVDLTIRLRQAGWGLFTDASLRYVHRLQLRTERSSRSDEPEGIRESLDAFERKWGFDRLCPDQDRMRSRLGESLVPRLRRDPSHWTSGIDDPPRFLENRVQLVRGLVVPGQAMRIASLGTGNGRLETMLAVEGIRVTPIEDRPHALESARVLQNRSPDHRTPHLVDDPAVLELPDGGLDLLVVDRVLERHPNPIALLRELHRVLASRGVLVLLAAWRSAREQLATPHDLGRFTPTALRSFLANSRLFRSIEFQSRPFEHPEPELLIYALQPCGAKPPRIGEPVLCR